MPISPLVMVCTMVQAQVKARVNVKSVSLSHFVG